MPEWSEDDFERMQQLAGKGDKKKKTEVVDDDDDEDVASEFQSLDFGPPPGMSELDEILSESSQEDSSKSTPQPPADDASWAETFGDDLPANFKGMKRSEFINTINELRRLASDNIQHAYNQSQQQPPAPPQPPKQVFVEDDFGLATGVKPDAFESKLDQFFQARMAPLQTQLMGLAAQNTMLFMSKKLKHFDRYEAEILQEAQRQPPVSLINGQGWQNAYNNVIARHYAEVQELEKASAAPRNDPPPVERGGSPPSNEPEQTSIRDMKPTRADYRMAEALGTDIRVYMAGKMMREAARRRNG